MIKHSHTLRKWVCTEVRNLKYSPSWRNFCPFIIFIM